MYFLYGCFRDGHRAFGASSLRVSGVPLSRLAVKGWKKAEAWQSKRSRTGLVDELSVEGGLVGLDRTGLSPRSSLLLVMQQSDGASDFRFQASMKQLPFLELMFSFVRSVVLFELESGLGGTKYTLDVDLRVSVGLRTEV